MNPPTAEELLTVTLSFERSETNWLVIRVTPAESVQSRWVPFFLLRTKLMTSLSFGDIRVVNGKPCTSQQRFYPESIHLGKEAFSYLIHALRDPPKPGNPKKATVLEKELAHRNNVGGTLFANLRWQLVEPNPKHQEYLDWHREELKRRTAAFFDLSVSFDIQAQEMCTLADQQLDPKSTKLSWQGTLYYSTLCLLANGQSRSSLAVLKELCQQNCPAPERKEKVTKRRRVFLKLVCLLKKQCRKGKVRYISAVQIRQG